MLDDPHLLQGLNVYRGMVTYDDVARDLGYELRACPGGNGGLKKLPCSFWRVFACQSKTNSVSVLTMMLIFNQHIGGQVIR